MSDGPMDRSNPSEKASYGRTFIYRWRNDVILYTWEWTLKGQGWAAWQMSDGPMDRSEKASYGRTIILPMAT